MRSAPKERGQGRVHGEWHGAALARGVLEQAIAISTASSATHGRNAATAAAWSSALAVKRVQNPRLTLKQLSPRAGVAAAPAVQEHPKVPGQGLGSVPQGREQHGPSPGHSVLGSRRLCAARWMQIALPSPLSCLPCFPARRVCKCLRVQHGEGRAGTRGDHVHSPGSESGSGGPGLRHC